MAIDLNIYYIPTININHMTNKTKLEILRTLKITEINFMRHFDKIETKLNIISKILKDKEDVNFSHNFFNKMLTKDYLDKAIKRFRKNLYKETGCTIETEESKSQ